MRCRASASAPAVDTEARIQTACGEVQHKMQSPRKALIALWACVLVTSCRGELQLKDVSQEVECVHLPIQVPELVGVHASETL